MHSQETLAAALACGPAASRAPQAAARLCEKEPLEKPAWAARASGGYGRRKC